MPRTTTLADLAGENAFVILGTVGNLLNQLDRQVFEGKKGLKKEYAAKATAGNYEHLCAVTEEYACQYLQATLEAKEGDLTG